MSGEAKLDDQPPDPSRMAAIKKGAQMYVAKKNSGRYSFFLVDILEWLPKKRGQKLGQVRQSLKFSKKIQTSKNYPDTLDTLDFCETTM